MLRTVARTARLGLAGRPGARSSSTYECCPDKCEVGKCKYIEEDKAYAAQNYAPIPAVITRAEGAEVWDCKGKRHFDFLSGYSALNQGHCNPHIVGALKKQADVCTLTSRAFYNDKMGGTAKRMSEMFGYQRTLFMNTGVEAVDTAIKVARRWGYDVKGVPEGQAKIVCANDNFHGRSVLAISLSTDPDSYAGFGPTVPGIIKIPYNDVPALEKALEDPNVVGYICEPIQGEAGVVVPDDGYLKKVSEICKAKKVLYIDDEVQTGMCRTGKWLAADYEGVRPDLVILGKALSGGVVPVSCVMGDDETILTIKPGQHGSTYGGNPLSMAVTEAALDVLANEKLAERSFELGERLRAGLATVDPDKKWITTIRGKGLLNAIVIRDAADKNAYTFCMCLKEEGLLAKPTHGDIIRFSPPLIMTDAQIDESLEMIRRAYAKFEAM